MDAAAYTSLEAFLAHHRALAAAPTRKPDEERSLREMSTLVEESLGRAERTALHSDSSTGLARRHRERALLKLRRALLAKGAIAG